MSRGTGLGRVDGNPAEKRSMAVARLLLLSGWVLASVGYYGAWIGHVTAAMTLSGADMGEFVKFLPGVLDGTLSTYRQLFYLPAFAVVASVALLVGSDRLRLPGLLQGFLLVLSVPVSLQMLPPAWSVASLLTAEFRAQTMALGVSWLMLATFWFWGKLPAQWTGVASAVVCLAAMALPAWQLFAAKPAIDAVYRTPPPIGWGFFLCMLGLALVAAGSTLLAARAHQPVGAGWTG